jgi:hypothetical protein
MWGDRDLGKEAMDVVMGRKARKEPAMSETKELPTLAGGQLGDPAADRLDANFVEAMNRTGVVPGTPTTKKWHEKTQIERRRDLLADDLKKRVGNSANNVVLDEVALAALRDSEINGLFRKLEERLSSHLAASLDDSTLFDREITVRLKKVRDQLLDGWLFDRPQLRRALTEAELAETA